MNGFRLNRAFEVKMEFGFREVEQKLLKIVIGPARNTGTFSLDIINMP